MFDDCYGSEFVDKEVDFIELLWSPKNRDVASMTYEEDYGHECENIQDYVIDSLGNLFSDEEEKDDLEFFLIQNSSRSHLAMNVILSGIIV